MVKKEDTKGTNIMYSGHIDYAKSDKCCAKPDK